MKKSATLVQHFYGVGYDRLLCHKVEDAAGPVAAEAVVGVVAIWDFEAVLHQEAPGERLALETQRLFVYTVEFMDLVHPVRVEAGHLHARKMLVVECLEFPPIEHRFALVLGTIHHGSKVVAVVW